jgi:hypothetical protein
MLGGHSGPGVSRAERKRWLIALLLLSAVAMALRWPALAVGRMSDDYMQHAMLVGLYPGDGYAPFDLYAFFRRGDSLAAHVEQGTLPWFSEPEFHGAVLRPLASLLLWLDHTLAPGRVRLWHLHSLVWFGATVVSFGLAARRLLPRWPAALAVVLFACDAGFVSPLGWLANRCVLVAAAFGFLAIWLHLEWRRGDADTPQWLRRHGPVLEAIAMILSLGGGEYALGVVALVFAWELCVGGAEFSGARERVLGGLRALAPALVPALIYLVIHRLFDYGTFGADVYADPIGHPLGWLRWAKLRLPKLATAAVWGVPASSIFVFRHRGAAWWYELEPGSNPIEIHFSHMRLGLAGIATVAVVVLLARAGLREDERRTMRAMVLGGALGLLPISVAPAHSRLLIVTQLAACSIVALLVFACARLLLGREPAPAGLVAKLRGVAILPAVAVMLWLNTYEDVRFTRVYLDHIDAMQASNVAAFTEGDLLEQELDGRDVIVLNGPSQTTGMYGPFLLHANGAAVPASWRSLALGGDYAMFAYRPRADTLELAAISGAWLRTPGELFFRRYEEQVPAGTTFDYPTLHIEILADEDGDPTKVRFRFPHSLDDPRYLFLISTNRGLMRWEVPPVRGSTVVPRPMLPYVGTREAVFAARGRGPK